MQSIPTSCCRLRLDDLRLHGSIPAALSALSQLLNLQNLSIYSNQRNHVSVGVIANLLQLQLLSLVGLGIEIHDGLKCLPTGITNPQLNNCSLVAEGCKGFCLQDVSSLPKVSSLDFSYCGISFETEAGVVDLHNIKELVSEGAVAEQSPESVIASLNTAKQLQALNLRAFRLYGGHKPHLQLGKLLSSLQSLPKLDVTSCRHVLLGRSEYTLLKLHSFACQYSQLSIVEALPFSPFSQAFQTSEGNISQLSL